MEKHHPIFPLLHRNLVVLDRRVDLCHAGQFVVMRREYRPCLFTLGDMLDGYVKNAEAREALVALWGYYGLPPSRLSAFYFAVATGGYLRDGAYYVKPRSQSLSNALTAAIRASGGRIRFGTAVDRIELENGAAAGVVLAYLKVFVFDRVLGRRRATVWLLAGLLSVVAVLLRLLMPSLPE